MLEMELTNYHTENLLGMLQIGYAIIFPRDFPDDFYRGYSLQGVFPIQIKASPHGQIEGNQY